MITFPKKREIVRISFQLRKDYKTWHDLPIDFHILATNEAIPLSHDPDGPTNIDGLRWSVLARAEGVEWANKDAVFTMEIPRCNVGKFRTYGISILKNYEFHAIPLEFHSTQFHSIPWNSNFHLKMETSAHIPHSPVSRIYPSPPRLPTGTP